MESILFLQTHIRSTICEWLNYEFKYHFSFLLYNYHVWFCFRLQVNNNGHLTFDQPWDSYSPAQFNAYTGRDIIAPFWTDIDNRGNGNISYNQYTSGSVLSQATRDINQYFPGVNFTASWVFVATWDNVAYYSYSGTVRYRIDRNKRNHGGTERRGCFWLS